MTSAYIIDIQLYRRGVKRKYSEAFPH